MKVLSLKHRSTEKSSLAVFSPTKFPGLQWIPYKLQVLYKWLLWSSLVAQLVKNPPAMRETGVQPMGWEDSLEKGKATHSSILAWCESQGRECKANTEMMTPAGRNTNFTREWQACPSVFPSPTVSLLGTTWASCVYTGCSHPIFR